MIGRRRTSAELAGDIAPDAPADVPCLYCSRHLPVADFSPWTARPELLSAACECGRTVTIAAATLRRQSAS